MNWGEIQIESLKKMFLNNEELEVGEIDDYLDDKKYKTYLLAMPQACNEAINYIFNNCGGIEVIEDIQRTNSEDFYDLSKLFEDYSKLKDVFCSQGIRWELITKDIIKISNWENGFVKIIYEKAQEPITNLTDIEAKINLEDKFVRIIPLYIAGELYKDDDLTLSTMYMNEFMTLIDNFKGENIRNPKISNVFTIE